MTITGMPDATAFFTGPLSASVSGMETTRPSGFEAMAASSSFTMAGISKVSGARYSVVTPSCLPASSTPFLTTDQY